MLSIMVNVRAELILDYIISPPGVIPNYIISPEKTIANTTITLNPKPPTMALLTLNDP